MSKIGLSLSGGGFRATLFHLGVVRFLRDTSLLEKVTHITSVSGGSIIGAHLALNWDRYNGSDEEFEEVALELIRFIQMDVRNRIVRRFPLGSLGNLVRSLLRLKPKRHWTRPGLLERYYQDNLFGATPLSRLPESPRLHILATNLSEGCICSFNRNGLLMQRRMAGRRDRFERVNAGLATIPMAVAASSCFPGFFPPLEITGWDIGADVTEFSRQAFTDGGVYDNLGLRMFRYLEQSRDRHATPLQPGDFLNIENSISALRSGSELPESTPIGQLHKIAQRYLARRYQKKLAEDLEWTPGDLANCLWEIIRTERLHRNPVFANLELDDPSAQALLNYAAVSKKELEIGDRLWLNRLLIDATISQVIGTRCLRQTRQSFDEILVSDAGGKFKVTTSGRATGLISTALRSSDILMDRVWQLESEAFDHASGVNFIQIATQVDRSKDRYAPDLEIQRQVRGIRTDLDFFSNLEISSLIRHGYCVARESIKDDDGEANNGFPEGAPWDPFDKTDELEASEKTGPFTVQESFQTAKQLRHSSKRKIWNRLFNPWDWPSYIWAALLIAVVIGLPGYWWDRHSRLKQQETIVDAVAELNPNYQMIIDLLENDATKEFEPLAYTEVESMETADLSGFEVISESRVFDLRGWDDLDEETNALAYNRTRVQRLASKDATALFRIQGELEQADYKIDCKTRSLNPQLNRMSLANGLYRWELLLDLSRIPMKRDVEIETHSILPPEMASAAVDEGRFSFTVRTDTGLLEIWVMMPENREYDVFEVSSHPIGQPELSEIVVPSASVRVACDSLATFRLINPEPKRRYECRWTWAKPGN